MPQVNTADLVVGTPVEAAAPDATFVVAISPNRPLRVGNYIFRLEVVDEAGRRSAPFNHRLIVQDSQAPNAVIIGPREIPFGQGFTLNGAESNDPDGGAITRFIWTLVEAP